MREWGTVGDARPPWLALRRDPATTRPAIRPHRGKVCATATRKKSRANKKKPAAKHAAPKRKEPRTLRLRAFTPGLTVNNIARSVAWYRDVLGFVVADEWRDKGVLRGAEMKAGAVTEPKIESQAPSPFPLEEMITLFFWKALHPNALFGHTCQRIP